MLELSPPFHSRLRYHPLPKFTMTALYLTPLLPPALPETATSYLTPLLSPAKLHRHPIPSSADTSYPTLPPTHTQLRYHPLTYSILPLSLPHSAATSCPTPSPISFPGSAAASCMAQQLTPSLPPHYTCH